MSSPNSPLNNTSIALEIEAIQRLRTLVPSLSTQCRVWRELNGHEPLLCLDFTDCLQDLNLNKKEWLEFVLLLALPCHHLGLANSMVFKSSKGIIGWVSLERIT